MMRRSAAVVATLGVLATTLGVLAASNPWPRDRGPGPMTLLTNEFASDHPDDAASARSADWWVTSGSLFAGRDYLWSGRPDDGRPGPASSPWTGSAVLRALSAREARSDTAVRFDLRINALTQTARTAARQFDGVHVMLRYQSEESTYYVSVGRRDGRYAIKRKTPGGPSNGGTYVTLAATDSPAPPRMRTGWHTVEMSIRGSRTVVVVLRVDGVPVLRAVEHKPASDVAPVAGRVGLRGDNCDFLVRGFRESARAAVL
jgi:hypothetical protein